MIKWGYDRLSKNRSFWVASAGVFIALSFKMPDFISVILFGSVLLISAYAGGNVKKILNKKPLLFLGDISYSMYLMHMPTLFFFFACQKIFIYK